MEYTQTQERILETALDLFSRKGFDTTTTREIAGNAGVNELTLFRNFGSKQNLLEEVMVYGFDAEGLRSSVITMNSGNIEKDLLDLMMRILDNMRGRERIYALMLRESVKNDIVRRKLSSIPGEMMSFMMNNLEKIFGDEKREDIDLETAGIFLVSYLLRSEIMRMLLGEDPFHDVDEARLEKVVSIFLHGYLGEGSS